MPLQIDTSAVAVAAVKDDASSPSSSVEENTLSRPQKSALKQLGTMNQTFEELRSFTQTPQYLALANALASFSLSSTDEEGTAASLAFTEGTRSEPMSPIVLGGNDATFLLPIFPAPTKYHFRGHDRRRASFPKSTSHPSRLNVNLNLNMNVSIHSAPATNATCRRATIGGGNVSGSDHHHHRHHHGGRLVPSASAKQLRFSLEVQELIFLPTSPPLRISRAKPTRAYSDPAIQGATCSSFIAPQQQQQQQQQNGLSPTLQHSLHRAGLISTATASAASFENTTTTFIKVHSSSRSSKLYLQDDEDENRPECCYNGDCHYEDCHEISYRGATSTDEEYDDDDEYDLETEDDDEEDLDDEEYDEFNGLGRKRPQHRYQRRQHTSRRYRLSSKDAIVARRAGSGNDTTHPAKAAGPGVLWQVYTAVTGVKELIAWYGSMVYHSSSL
ncbi:hypothetical protein BGZ95_004134 [Linnemannia exigua]|uniref:Uncharacterized protein n=1 Tax=Linnemannia exigua TaxID=604196 RepID=A0AAD4DJA0_9FUNG|nr:hypothetical protein BGZ95_004134 [Linnemannia exigua]